MLYVVEWIPAATLVRVSPVCILIHLLCAFFASCAKGERVESIVIPHPIVRGGWVFRIFLGLQHFL